MENYESLGTIGEGTYGVVLKCRHKTTGQIVAIKRFKESDDDEQVKKTALREIKILKQLRHENIVSLLEVFRVKGKLYLVFEFVEKTILEEIEKNPEGLDPLTIKRLMWQLLRAIHFCHQHNIIHRDIKPENLLVSRNGVLKLCDFGFARPLASAGAKYTEYVSTRWYRAPELLVGDVSYGKAVDVWSIGCMFAEIATGLPLFPGDSDIDQLYHIIKCLGHMTSRHQELFKKNALYMGVKLPQATELEPLEARFPQMDKVSMDFLKQTIKEEPLDRWTCAELLQHPYFENAAAQFEDELKEAIARDLNEAAALKKKRTRRAPRSTGMGAVMGPPVLPSGAVNPMADDGAYANEAFQYQNTHQRSPQIPEAAAPMLKPAPKPLHLSMTTPKDKMVFTSSKKAPLHCGNTGSMMSNPTSSYHLPTLNGGGAGAESSLGFLAKRQLFPEEDNHEVAAVAPVPSDHVEYIQQQQAMRVSMTSHGGRHTQQQGLSTLGRSYGLAALGTHGPSGAAGPSSKTNGSHHKGNGSKRYAGHDHSTGGGRASRGHGGQSHLSSFVSCSLQSSMEIYSPKKYPTGSRKPTRGAQAAAAPAASGNSGGMSMAMDLTPQGIYVPPRTSHGSTANRGAMASRDHGRRGDNDGGRTY